MHIFAIIMIVNFFYYSCVCDIAYQWLSRLQAAVRSHCSLAMFVPRPMHQVMVFDVTTGSIYISVSMRIVLMSEYTHNWQSKRDVLPHFWWSLFDKINFLASFTVNGASEVRWWFCPGVSALSVCQKVVGELCWNSGKRCSVGGQGVNKV